MNRAGDHVLADAAFACQQHGGPRAGDARDGRENFLHRRAVADDIFELIALAQGFAKLAVFVAKLANFQGFFDDHAQMIEGKRLGKKVDSSLLHRLHRDFHRAERRHHDHRSMLVLLIQFFEQRQAVHAGELQIGEHQVDVAGELDAFLGGAGGFHLVAGGRKMQADHAAVLLFVFDHQDRLARHHSLLSMKRKENAKYAAFAGRARDCDLAAVLIHDLRADGQAQPHAVRLWW